MGAEDTSCSPVGTPLHRTGHKFAGAIGAVLALGGIAWLILPFVHSGREWRWRLDTSTALHGAEVNAQIADMEDGGMIVHRVQERPISVISPPLSLTEEHGRVVEVRAALPEAASPVISRVVLLWQTEPRPEFKFEVATFELLPESTALRFSLPVAASDVHRLGVQFPDLNQPVRIEQVSLPLLNWGERLALAGRQVLAIEPVDASRLNAVRGPQVLGTRLVPNVAALMAIGMGICLAGAGLLRRRPPWRGLVAVLIGGFVACDLLFTWNMARQAREEAARFAPLDQRGRMAAAYGSAMIEAVDMLRDNARGEGSTFAVISDDAFGPAHRMGYLAAPDLVRVEDLQYASQIVVYHSSTARYEQGVLVLGPDVRLSVLEPATIADGVLIFRRRWTGTGLPPLHRSENAGQAQGRRDPRWALLPGAMVP